VVLVGVTLHYLLGLAYLQLFRKVGNMKYISKPRICPVCKGVGWLKPDGDSHPICPSCWGGGAIIVPEKKPDGLDRLIKDLENKKRC